MKRVQKIPSITQEIIKNMKEGINCKTTIPKRIIQEIIDGLENIITRIHLKINLIIPVQYQLKLNHNSFNVFLSILLHLLLPSINFYKQTIFISVVQQ